MAGLPERAIVAALASAGELEDGDTVLRFNLGVRRALAVPVQQSSFAFPVAFAVVRSAQASTQSPTLRYFRVADHLQRMGLGWRTTLALLDGYPDLELDLATRAPELRSGTSEGDRVRYVRLFRAAKRVAARMSSS
jgi:hypothetical protein